MVSCVFGVSGGMKCSVGRGGRLLVSCTDLFVGVHSCP